MSNKSFQENSAEVEEPLLKRRLDNYLEDNVFPLKRVSSITTKLLNYAGSQNRIREKILSPLSLLSSTLTMIRASLFRTRAMV